VVVVERDRRALLVGKPPVRAIHVDTLGVALTTRRRSSAIDQS
jgi:hypothetical protein